MLRLATDRRLFARYSLPAMYSPIAVRRPGSESDRYDIAGHIYDISEGGMRFELDEAVRPGSRIAVRITLAGMHHRRRAEQAVFAFANVVWIEDEDEPAPYKMAATFVKWGRAGDLARLRAELVTGRYAAAA